MDLKGSLVDTNLRIYPSEKLITFLKTIPSSDQLPHNINEIIRGSTKETFKSYSNENTKPVHLSTTEVEILKKIRDAYSDLSQETNTPVTEPCNKAKVDNKEQEKEKETDQLKKELEESEDLVKENVNSEDSKKRDNDVFLVTADIDWLYEYIKDRRSKNENDTPYLHTLLEGAHIEMPENKTIKRNPILEARCVKLRAQQEAREYRKMTKGVDNVRMKFPEDSISYQLKQLNRQLIAIGQFIISIFAGFLFGFRGVEWMVGNLDFGFRLLLGVMCALVIALAEIYFLAKKLNEELSIPETVQLGGPLKFADQQNYTSNNNKTRLDKEHQD